MDEIIKRYEILAGNLYAHSMFHEGETNSTAQLMRDGADAIRVLVKMQEEMQEGGYPCCGDFDNCKRACTPRGRNQVKKEVKDVFTKFWYE